MERVTDRTGHMQGQVWGGVGLRSGRGAAAERRPRPAPPRGHRRRRLPPARRARLHPGTPTCPQPTQSLPTRSFQVSTVASGLLVTALTMQKLSGPSAALANRIAALDPSPAAAELGLRLAAAHPKLDDQLRAPILANLIGKMDQSGHSKMFNQVLLLNFYNLLAAKSRLRD